jgi:diphthamide biosynthesis enzyme Dph1/Dph2-like protein
MKVLFIESKLKDSRLDLSEEDYSILPKNIFLVYTVQYKGLASSLKEILKNKGHKITGFKQVLGCSKINKIGSVLFIGTGRFHAINIFFQSDDIYILENEKIIKVPKEEIESFKSRRRAAIMRFYSSENLGILVSTKPGQDNIKDAKRIKAGLRKKGKNAYIFISNDIDVNQFQNFYISSWINTSCKGLALDSSNIINSYEIKK